jgi:uroporphyrinogen-III synthase
VGSQERVLEQARGWTSPRFAPVPLAWSTLVPRLEPAQALGAVRYHRPDLVLLTSPFAVAMLGAGAAQGQPAACVGEATAMAARAAGFDVVVVGRAGAAALVETLLARHPRPRSVLWLRGAEVVGVGAERLRAASVAVHEVITYDADPRAAFAAEVQAAPEPAAVLVHSPRAAVALADALLAVDRVLPRGAGLYGLGASAAARLRDLGFAGAVSVAPADLRGFLAGLA